MPDVLEAGSVGDASPPDPPTFRGTAVAVIPARLKSERFPEKVLADQTGRPLVQHVVDQVRRCGRLTDVVVAADDERIVEALRPFGTRVVLTDPNHPSGTDRVAEAAAGLDADIVVNVQGDEPEIDPAAVDRLVDELGASSAPMATLATEFPSNEDDSNPNLVKVARSLRGLALYFSRSPIPYDRDGISKGQGRPVATTQATTNSSEVDVEVSSNPKPPPAASHHRGTPPGLLLHVGVYAYRHRFLMELTQLAPTPLEQLEKLEQLRVLEHGHAIAVAVVEHRSHGIDTPQQYAAFVQRWSQMQSGSRSR